MNSKVGQLISIGISGPELTKDEETFIVNNNIGGVTLFARNCESPQQLHKLCTQLNGLKSRMADKAPLFIAVDMEGGRVARLKAPFTQWPPLAKLGALDSPSMAFNFAFAMGNELRSVGINVDFAPCIDVLSNPDNAVIGDRAVGNDPEIVAKIASALVRGYIKSGIIPCAKHFPGHGDTSVDSHEDLPVIDIDESTLQNREFVPFKKAMRARLEMMMTGHLMFPKVDAEWPATLSEKFLKKILRDDLRYRGIVISDDLDMKALANKYDKAKIPVQALKAGCDILLYCNEPDSPPIAMEAVQKALADGQLSDAEITEKHSRVMSSKRRLKDFAPKPMTEVARVVGHPDHLKISKAIADGQIIESVNLG
ncbi:MAG: beta-N-acetylhexosaminidase [Bdellovibrionales bacterium]|nr:beta-N-acetylhexosaminidase [Bdellovibrionales bacterium]